MDEIWEEGDSLLLLYEVNERKSNTSLDNLIRPGPHPAVLKIPPPK